MVCHFRYSVRVYIRTDVRMGILPYGIKDIRICEQIKPCHSVRMAKKCLQIKIFFLVVIQSYTVLNFSLNVKSVKIL